MGANSCLGGASCLGDVEDRLLGLKGPPGAVADAAVAGVGPVGCAPVGRIARCQVLAVITARRSGGFHGRLSHSS